MAFGVLVSGFIPKTLSDLKTELEAAWRAEFGANSAVGDPNEPDGQVVGIISERLAELWELANAVYGSQDPDEAIGQAQDAVCAITGTQRDPASRSTVTLTATGTPNTLLNSGREASVISTGDRFRTLANATITAVTAWAPTTSYVPGDRRTNSGKVYLCITAGTSAGSGGPTGNGSDIVDNTVHWRYLGDGTGAIDVAAEAAETGPTSGVAFSITVIETPVSGWDSVTNILDAVVGSDVESHEHLRAKRESELSAAGSATIEAIRTDILKVAGVLSCTVYQNTTMATDADGRPPKSIEAVVEGGADADIRAAIFATVAAGIETHGSVSGTVTDSQGFTWTIKFNRPTIKNIWVRVDVIKNPSVFPVDGSDQIKAAIVGDEPYYVIGRDVTASRVQQNVWDVAGVLDITLTYIGTSNPPTAPTTIVNTARERADFDTGRVIVNLSDGTP